MLAAPAARAATLPFTATLSISIGTLPTATFTGSGVGQSAGPGGSFALPSNFLMGTFTAPITTAPPATKLILQLMGNGSGSFNPSFAPPLYHPTVTFLGAPRYGVSLGGGGVGGPLRLSGSAGIRLFGFTTLWIPLTAPGLGSTATGSLGGIVVQVVATQWTTGTGKVLGAAPTPYHLPASMSITVYSPVTLTGSDARTAGGQGMVTLVSPVKVHGNQPGFTRIPVITRLTVNFIPEPGTLVLLAGGIIALAARARRHH